MEILERVTASFEHLLHELNQRDRFNSLTTKTKLLSGHPKVNILQEVEAEPASLIVMGTKGATAARKLLFGSLTTEIILHSSVPVLAIPEGTRYADFNQVVFATDYSREDLEKVHQAIEFARFFDAQLRVVHVASHESMETDIRFLGFQELVMSEHPDEEIQFDLKYERNFFSGIADYIRVNDVDLLMMVRYKKSFWESLTTRNYSKELGFYTTIPLLVFMSPSED